MRKEDYLSWYEDLARRLGAIKKHRIADYENPTFYYDQAESFAWLAEAGSALASVFPPGHFCLSVWSQKLPGVRPELTHGGTLEHLFGVFKGALKQIQDGRLADLVDAIRADSESELLEQADALSQQRYLAAAAVIAGGALETHLRHYVAKLALAISGGGSISKYNNAIGQARKSDPAGFFSANVGKLVEGWGGIRNDAAHSPGTFGQSNDEVARMIAGIRDFIAQTS